MGSAASSFKVKKSPSELFEEEEERGEVPSGLSRSGSLNPFSSSTTVDDDELHDALRTAMSPGLSHTVDVDQHSVPTWFSLMKAGLSYRDDTEVYSPPCLGIVLESSAMQQSEGASEIGDESEHLFAVAPLVSMSQSFSILSALYVVKPDDERKITAYADYLLSPLITVAFGSLITNEVMVPGADVLTVSCEGVLVVKVDDLLNAMEHYSTHNKNKSVEAMKNIFAARYADSRTLAIRCLMRVPLKFWQSDKVLHTMGRVCLYGRAPSPSSSSLHVITPGYRNVMMSKWMTPC
jgi:hypothetical protein